MDTGEKKSWQFVTIRKSGYSVVSKFSNLFLFFSYENIFTSETSKLDAAWIEEQIERQIVYLVIWVNEWILLFETKNAG